MPQLCFIAIALFFCGGKIISSIEQKIPLQNDVNFPPHQHICWNLAVVSNCPC